MHVSGLLTEVKRAISDAIIALQWFQILSIGDEYVADCSFLLTTINTRMSRGRPKHFAQQIQDHHG